MDSFLLFCLLLVSCLRPSWGSLQHNMTMPDMDLDFSGLNSDESESELSSQLQEIDERSNGWSGWSSWSPCSRSCDGGVVHQIRTCRNGPCRGDHVRYKICNMQGLVALFACLAVANAGLAVIPGSAKIIQAPSSRTTVAGPDGSLIHSEQPGASIITEDSPAIVARSEPLIAAPVSYSAPLVYSAPLAYSAPVVHGYSASLAYSAGVVAEKQLDTLVAGPSGTIATSKTVHSPALVAAAPQVYAAGLHTYY